MLVLYTFRHRGPSSRLLSFLLLSLASFLSWFLLSVANRNRPRNVSFRGDAVAKAPEHEVECFR